MAYNLKKELEKPERLAGGHRLCAGCGAGIAVRGVLRALEPEDKAVITNATGCLEVSTFIYPHTAYYDSYIHTAFANAAATCSGVEAAYNVLKKKGKVKDNFKFIAFGGDGGTYDIGLVCPAPWAWTRHGVRLLRQRSLREHRYPGRLRLRGLPMRLLPGRKSHPGQAAEQKNLTEIIPAPMFPYAAQTHLYRKLQGSS